MTQRHEQFLRMLDTTGVEHPVNVVNDHSPDRFPTMGLLQQVVCQGGGRDFRNVLVLADGGVRQCPLMTQSGHFAFRRDRSAAS
jgi:hypothetical protein